MGRDERDAFEAGLDEVVARFDLHRDASRAVPYLLLVQSDFLNSLPTRLVIPLVPEPELDIFVRRLHLRVEIEGEPYVLATALMGAVPKGQLGPRVGSLADRHFDIVNAIDFLLQGF